jgi:antitoxin FitA
MECMMATLTVRNLPDEIHRALRVRAAQHGVSAEAEVREIIAAAVMPDKRLRMGDALAQLGAELGLTDDDINVIERGNDRTPASPKSFT